MLLFSLSKNLLSSNVWFYVLGNKKANANIKVFMIKNIDIICIFLKDAIICSWLHLVYADLEGFNILKFLLMVSLWNWLSIFILDVVWCSIHYLKQKRNHIFMLNRKDVVSLSDGLFANVILIWQEVCWSNHTNNIIFEKRALYHTISWYRLESVSKFVCKG